MGRLRGLAEGSMLEARSRVAGRGSEQDSIEQVKTETSVCCQNVRKRRDDRKHEQVLTALVSVVQAWNRAKCHATRIGAGGPSVS